MKKNEIMVLRALMCKSKTLKELAGDMGLSKSYISELTSILHKKKFIKKKKEGRMVSISISEPKDIYLKKLADEFSLQALLSGKKDFLLTQLLEPKKISELEASISKSCVYKDISELRSLGVVLMNNKKYYVNPRIDNLINLLGIMNEESLYDEVNKPAIVLWRQRNKRLEKNPKDYMADGELTAFSRFSDYGIPYITPYNYVFYPANEVSIEEIFIHSLIASETKTQRSMCVIFYLKNKGKLDRSILKKLAKEYNVVDLYVNMEHYIATKEEGMFLPWTEFLDKAKLYNIKPDEHFGGEKLLSVLEKIGGIIEKEIDIYLIGGGNMIIRGVKESTKDVDIVLGDVDEYHALTKSLKEIGYSESSEDMKLYKSLQPSTIMYKAGNLRFDIFVRRVCGAIELSPGMKSNALFFKNFDKVNVYLISPEGLFIFKAITGREGDLEDTKVIAKKYLLDWKWIFEEVISQEEKSKKTFSFAVLDTLEVLEEGYGIAASITKKMRSHCLQEAILLALDKPRNRTELKELIDFPMSQIDNALKRLEKKQRINVDRSRKPIMISCID